MTKLWGKEVSKPPFNCILIDSQNNYYKYFSSNFQNEQDLIFNTDKPITYTNGGNNFITKYSTSLFIVINKNVLQSTDGGLTWNYIYELPYSYPSGIAISEDGIIVIPMKDTFGSNEGHFFVSYSNDLGRTWNDLQISTSYLTRMGNIVYGNGLFACVSNDYVFYSTNGKDWSNANSGITNWTICYGDGKFVISGATTNHLGGYTCYSVNCQDWIPSNTHGVAGSKMTYTNNKFYIYQNSSNYISVSIDAIDWINYKPNSNIESRYFCDLAYSETHKKFYCSTVYPKILESTDGIDWSDFYIINSATKTSEKKF